MRYACVLASVFLRRLCAVRAATLLSQASRVSVQMSDILLHRWILYTLVFMLYLESFLTLRCVCGGVEPVGSLNTALASACVWTMLFSSTAMLGTLFVLSCFSAACKDQQEKYNYFQ